MVAGRQRPIVQLRAVVARVNVGDDLASVPVRIQKRLCELVERPGLGTGDLDRAVHRCAKRGVRHRIGHVIRCDRLQKGRRQPNDVAVDAGFDDAVDELEELGGANDRIRNSGRLDNEMDASR